MSQFVELSSAQLSDRRRPLSQSLRTPLLGCALIMLSACSTPRGSREPWVYIMSRNYYPTAFDGGEVCASVVQSGSSETALLALVAVFALPFLLDTAFLPITIPHDLILVE